jgi:predicted histone-like DNA-binding protein
MPILYKAVQSILPSKDGIRKWFPSIVRIGRTVSTRTVAQRIAILSSLSAGDVYNVLINLATVIGQCLSNSQSVYIEGLGTFSIYADASGNGVNDKKDVTYKQINNLRVNFTPTYTVDSDGTRTRLMFIEKIEYVKVDPKFVAVNEDDEEVKDPNVGPVDPPSEWEDPTA